MYKKSRIATLLKMSKSECQNSIFIAERRSRGVGTGNSVSVGAEISGRGDRCAEEGRWERWPPRGFLILRRTVRVRGGCGGREGGPEGGVSREDVARKILNK